MDRFVGEKQKGIEGQRLAARKTRGWRKDPGREMGEDGNQPGSKGELGQQGAATGEDVRGLLGQRVLVLHFKLLLALCYRLLCYPFLLQKPVTHTS